MTTVKWVGVSSTSVSVAVQGDNVLQLAPVTLATLFTLVTVGLTMAVTSAVTV